STTDQPSTIHFGNIVGQSQSMLELFKTMDRVIHLGANQLLVTGETGTGKDIVARALHDYSSRRQKRFVAINCNAIPYDIAESELFGHVRGAFTGADQDKPGVFEIADGGTLFLDEIGDVPPQIQSKLLRVLQDREVLRVGAVVAKKVDVCVIAATNRDLAKAIEAGQFREDLYFRLNVIPLHLPPLRDRHQDISLLIDHFLQKFGQEYPTIQQKSILSSARSTMQTYSWPGNVRQLENCLKRAYLLSESSQITPVDLPDEIFDSTIPPTDLQIEISDQGVSLEQVIGEYIQAALRQANGVQTKAASLLGMSRRRLQSRMNHYGFNSKDYKN
ncbi:MAG: sigma-54 dependent transcriptional regulator, partial [Candidatus Poribacteria bacterium]|nr:sigma-54 dependent transcriptional regulator [Candidatus Poribacteria bacterium]